MHTVGFDVLHRLRFEITDDSLDNVHPIRQLDLPVDPLAQLFSFDLDIAISTFRITVEPYLRILRCSKHVRLLFSLLRHISTPSILDTVMISVRLTDILQISRE